MTTVVSTVFVIFYCRHGSEGNVFTNRKTDTRGSSSNLVSSHTSSGSYMLDRHGEDHGFGSDSLFPYDILTQFTTRGVSQHRQTLHSPYSALMRNSAVQRSLHGGGSHGDSEHSRSSMPGKLSHNSSLSNTFVNDNIRRAQLLGVDGNNNVQQR